MLSCAIQALPRLVFGLTLEMRTVMSRSPSVRWRSGGATAASSEDGFEPQATRDSSSSTRAARTSRNQDGAHAARLFHGADEVALRQLADDVHRLHALRDRGEGLFDLRDHALRDHAVVDRLLAF